ncbi:uncharacterized protein STEHIDRAFT_144352 [Stereum hirsutum FP-91666 SS1]|uniref:uncharacterized protein n=1 Tax=Stereum hirsutum (strain FP-91666) TaxID=721885 RepID=UPI000440E0E6|nr:uncharacterized protein STEHIDRAFT_144352 [Stereum hirsutum FP-91666 SS1]EIM90824.1 hypothetical protein STEHIDRAFT_144352 [Stereum hirsutum FP-91666 SS1]
MMTSVSKYHASRENIVTVGVVADWMSCQKTVDGGMNATLLDYGVISCSFGRHAARRIFEAILHVPFDSLHVCYEGSRSCFFLPPSVLGYAHMPICLDFRHDPSISIIPQRYWQPTTDSNCGRYVTGAKLQNPIFLDHLNGKGFGLTVEEACNGQGAHLRRWNETVELGGKANIQLRIWLHADAWQRQISTRDQKLRKNTIPLRQFVKQLGNTVRDYLKSYSLFSETGQLINDDDIVILAAVHVSAGSWQPILACCSGKVYLEG